MSSFYWGTQSEWEAGSQDYTQARNPPGSLTLGIGEETIQGATKVPYYKMDEILAVLLRFSEGGGSTVANEGKGPDANLLSYGWEEREDGRRYVSDVQAEVPYHSSMAMEDESRYGYRDHFSGGLTFRYPELSGVSESMVKRDGRFDLFMEDGYINNFEAYSHLHEVSDEEVRFEGYGTSHKESLDHGNLSSGTVEVFDLPYLDKGTEFLEGTDYEIDTTTGEVWALSGGSMSLNEAYFISYYYDERYSSEAMDASPYVISPGEWHTLWFSVKPGEMRLNYDGNEIYAGGWAPGKRSYRYRHDDPGTPLEINCSGDLAKVYLFGWSREPLKRGLTGAWKSQVIDFGTDESGEDVREALSYLQPSYQLDSYEHSISIEVRFADDEEELEYSQPLKWYLGEDGSGYQSYEEKVFPETDGPLYYGRYMQVRLLFQIMDLDRPLPVVEGLGLETYRLENAQPQMTVWEEDELYPGIDSLV
ncbi:hypothetical protein K9M78_07555 [Candidatus Bipolaricaulota bacterium]|nr:hypothetical protein [Candidatus Bipolaricaulota bacterium]